MDDFPPIITDTHPPEQELAFLEEKLMAFNSDRIPGYTYSDLLFKVMGSSSVMEAGLHGQIGGSWFYISGLWVARERRGQGLGRKLVSLAETTALDKGCCGVYLYTYSFQNPGFYTKLGYEVFGTLEDFCGDHAKFYMKKRLA